MELTIQLEKQIPLSLDITLQRPSLVDNSKVPETVTQITNHIINGNVTSISNRGHGAEFNLQIGFRDANAVAKSLVEAGIAEVDAKQFSEIIASEEGQNGEEPFGGKARAWIAKNIHKAVDGTWKIGISVATKLLSEAAMRYYEFK